MFTERLFSMSGTIYGVCSELNNIVEDQRISGLKEKPEQRNQSS